MAGIRDKTTVLCHPSAEARAGSVAVEVAQQVRLVVKGGARDLEAQRARPSVSSTVSSRVRRTRKGSAPARGRHCDPMAWPRGRCR